jgi:hypothetical protein
MAALTKKLLRNAAAHLWHPDDDRGRDGFIYEGQDEEFMCYALRLAGAGHSARHEFDRLLDAHGAPAGGALGYTDYPAYRGAISQGTRFMFLHFLAESL